MRILLIIFIVFILFTGCTNLHDEKMAKYHYQSQQSIATTPIISIEAKENETIVLSGVKKFEVYAPQGQEMNQFQKQYHPAWGIFGDTLRVGLPAFIGGYWAVELADVVGKRTTQSVGGNYVGGNKHDGDAIGGDFTDGDQFGGDYNASDNTHDPVVVDQPPPVVVNSND